MATVYLAEDVKHGRRVAIKVMNSNLSASDRFLREIEIAARLTHPHILPLHDSGLINDQPYYVMPYIEGESLRQRMLRLKAFSIDDALRFAKEIASALGYAHQKGLVHRDIKPENILLSNGIALVADFGIARFTIANDVPAITMANGVIGTPAYMSPEQIHPGLVIDGRADLYSLGCVLYEMLVGSPPFSGPLHSLAYQHVSVEPRSVSQVRPEVPSYVAEAVSRLLAKNPVGRYATAAEFVNAISTEAATVSFEVPKPQVTTNLPKDRTRFIGRNQELKDCTQLLENSRLLTLTGLGGCGKTRLAIKVAESVTAKFPAGAWFVDLAPLTEANRVVGAVAQVLGLREEAGKDLNELVTAHLLDKKLLLILDNCEHLLSSCADLVDELLNSCTEVRIVATSREALNVQGERVLHLPPLLIPDAKANLSLENVKATDAIKLFVDRAQIVRPSFELTAENFASVAEVCRRLDGIPLALELAAARVKILSIGQILTKLDDRFKLLSSVGRTMLPRHQTLRAVIEWSYDQLANEEQKLLRALSVFAGGWTLALAAALVSDLDEFEILELHSQLVDKSIVVVSDDQSASPRYSFLETVRQFLFEQLTEQHEAESIRDAHFKAMLELAEQAYAERVTEEERWTLELEVESDNMRVALDFARSRDAEEYLRLVGALAWFWIVKTRLAEGREHLTAALASSDVKPSRSSRARALWGAAHMLALQGETSKALSWIDEARVMSHELGDTAEIALALEGIGWMHFFRSEDEAACEAFEECLRLQLVNGMQHLIIRAKVGLAQVLVALGRTDQAKPMAQEIIEFADVHNDKRSEHFGWHYLADCELILGNCQESLKLYQKSLALANAMGDKVEISFEVQGVAMSLAGHDRTIFPSASHVAIQLAGAVKAEWDRLGADIHVRFWDELLDRYLGAARKELSTEDFEREWKKGRETPFEDAVQMALTID
jgi:non-specific serine/threonine protein kinase